jgi:hypothetical protein
MTTIDEKEILEIEKLKLEIKDFEERSRQWHKNFEERNRQWHKELDIKLSNKHYEAWRVALYGIAVGLGGTFAIAKTISLMGW